MVLSDGSLAAAECSEEDDWESAAEASESSNLPQNVSEDTGCPALTMPLAQLLSAEDAAGLGLIRTRWLSLTVAASLTQVQPDEPRQKSEYKECCIHFALCFALCTGFLQGLPLKCVCKGVPDSTSLLQECIWRRLCIRHSGIL